MARGVRRLTGFGRHPHRHFPRLGDWAWVAADAGWLAITATFIDTPSMKVAAKPGTKITPRITPSPPV